MSKLEGAEALACVDLAKATEKMLAENPFVSRGELRITLESGAVARIGVLVERDGRRANAKTRLSVSPRKKGSIMNDKQPGGRPN